MIDKEETVNNMLLLGLITPSQGGDKALDRFLKNGDSISFVPHSGRMTNDRECSNCRLVLSYDKFNNIYYSRVDSKGYLMYSNALCINCSDFLNKQRRQSLSKDKNNIPDKPNDGDICPHCQRHWYNNWHRHHSVDTNEFVAWICGHCNMSLSDRRNKGVVSNVL